MNIQGYKQVSEMKFMKFDLLADESYKLINDFVEVQLEKDGVEKIDVLFNNAGFAHLSPRLFDENDRTSVKHLQMH